MSIFAAIASPHQPLARAEGEGLLGDRTTRHRGASVTYEAPGFLCVVGLPHGAKGADNVSFYTHPATGESAFVCGRLFGLPQEERESPEAVARTVLELRARHPEDWPRRLRGQFAIVCWDPRDRTLEAVRDRHGIIPLYFRTDGERITFASTAKQLLWLNGATPQPDAGFVARFLVDDMLRTTACATEETYFVGVRRVRPAHRLRAKEGRWEQRPYWTLAEVFSQPKWSDADPQRYLALLEEVVREQGEGVPELAASLSGGLDSPVLAVLLNRIAGGRGPLRTVSLEALGQGVDESENVRAVLDMVNAEPLWVQPNTEDLFSLLRESTWHYECPTFNPSPAVLYLLKRTAAEHGIHTLFTGLGADEVLGGINLGYLADLYWRGRWWRMVRELNAYHALDSLRLGMNRQQLFRNYVLDPARLLHVHRRVPPWIRPELVSAYGLQRRAPKPERPAGLSHFDAHTLSVLTRTYTPTFLHYEAHSAIACGMEYRLPYLDDRIVDYVGRLPWHERMADGLYKVHHRKAVAGIIPAQTAQQTGKTLMPTVHDNWIRNTLRENVRDILHGNPLAAEYVDLEQVRREHALYEASEDPAVHIRLRGSTWRTVSLELWLQAFHS